MKQLTKFFGLLFLVLSAAAGADESAPPTAPEFQVVAATAQHIELLRQGGLVLYMRHGRTDARFPDQIPVDLNDCNKQRPLSDQGREQLAEIGGYIALLHLPYQQVISSPFCRAQETAGLVFAQPLTVDVALRYTAAMSTEEKQPAVERTRHWISKPLTSSGQNRVVVAHGPNIAEIMDYLPPEASIIIFRPAPETGQGFQYVASIEPQHWEKLLQELDLP